MGRKVVWSADAKMRFREIAGYWNTRNKSTAHTQYLRKAIRDKLAQAAKMPGIGSLTDEYGIYKTLVRDYYLFYQVDNSNLILLDVWDTRRNPDEAPYSY